MIKVKHYADYDFTGLLRPDHAPAMYSENQNNFVGGMSVGYEITGKIFAIGCIKGAADAFNIPMEQLSVNFLKLNTTKEIHNKLSATT